MIGSQITFLLPYLLSALLSLWIARAAWRRRGIPGSAQFAGVAFFEVIWTAGYIASLATDSLSGKLFWNNVQFFGAVGAPAAYLGFALEYDRPTWGKGSRSIWKLVIPTAALMLAFIWSDRQHGLFRGAPFVEQAIPFTRLVFTDGPGFGIYTVYAYSLLVITTLLLISRYLQAEQLYRIQIGILLFGVLIPWVTTIVTALNLVPVRLHDITPITFGISNLIIAWALFRYHLFETIPVARDFLIENMQEGIIVLDNKLRIVDLNPAAQKILRSAKILAIGRPITLYQPFQSMWFENIAANSSKVWEAAIMQDGVEGLYEVQASSIGNQQGQVAIYLVVLRDIRDRKKIEDSLHLLAVTDPLTHIFNRRYFFSRSETELERARHQSTPISVILFDIDHFKLVNDTHGHLAGDAVLEDLTRACQKDLRGADVFGRYGGEEFTVLLPETGEEAALAVAERLRRRVEDLAVVHHGCEIQVTISLGVACKETGGSETLDELLERADRGLYQAKTAGRNRAAVGR